MAGLVDKLNEHMVSPKNKIYVDCIRFGFTICNFVVSVLLALTQLVNAFHMDGIRGKQIFQADHVLQSFTVIDPVKFDTLIKEAYGEDADFTKMVNEVTALPKMLPDMYEVSGSNSILRMDAVHCNFMLFSALWIASAFSLSMSQFPGFSSQIWSHIRVVVVHTWNLLGLIFTMVIFTATTKWSTIPTSNLLYTLLAQIMAWSYQYFHICECTQNHIGNLKIKYKTANDDQIEEMQASIELRKMIYMEASVVTPMLLVACMMPGAIGVDEWRVQTVLFSSWTLFALLGLHLRFRKSLNWDNFYKNRISPDLTEDAQRALDKRAQGGVDALGFLTYAIFMVYLMLLNAMGSNMFYDSPWATARIVQSRWGAKIIFFVASGLVIETIVQSIRIRFFSRQKSTNSEVQNWVNLSLIGNVSLIFVGSCLVKIVIFSGISDVNGLTAWHLEGG